MHRRSDEYDAALDAPIESRLHGPHRARRAVRRRDGARGDVRSLRRGRATSTAIESRRRSTAACRRGRRALRGRRSSSTTGVTAIADRWTRRRRRAARATTDAVAARSTSIARRGRLAAGARRSVDEKSAVVHCATNGRIELRVAAISLGAARRCPTAASAAAASARPTCSRPGDVVYVAQRCRGQLAAGAAAGRRRARWSRSIRSDGAIVALTGGFDFFASKYNRAMQARRQPGSAFKPFLYSAALEQRLHAGDARQRCADRDRGSATLEGSGGRRTSRASSTGRCACAKRWCARATWSRSACCAARARRTRRSTSSASVSPRTACRAT